MQNYNENVNPNMDYGNPYENYNAPTFFKNEGQENLIRWQLDIHEKNRTFVKKTYSKVR